MRCGLPRKSLRKAGTSHEHGKENSNASASPWYHVQRKATAWHHCTRQTSSSFTEKRLGGLKISRMAAGLRDRWLLEQGDFPLLAPPGAGRRIPGSVRVNDSAVVAERLMA